MKKLTTHDDGKRMKYTNFNVNFKFQVSRVQVLGMMMNKFAKFLRCMSMDLENSCGGTQTLT
jgi:hypothetical protein